MNMNKEKEKKELSLSFDRNIIKHLGLSMYHSIPPAIAELIANSYDADAENVIVTINNEKKKEIEVIDDGFGMSLDDVNNKFLRIGMNRREKFSNTTRTPKGRHVTGKKGVGKLALFGLANTISIETTKKGTEDEIVFTLNWDDITSSGDAGDYKFNSEIRSVKAEEHYTKIKITDLKRKSSINVNDTAERITWLFNFIEDDFNVTFREGKYGDPIKIDNNIKYTAIDVKKFEELDSHINATVIGSHKYNINGEIYVYTKPVPNRYNGITLYSNGRMVNDRSFFGVRESDYFCAYVAGWLDLDFVDKHKDELISTNRQSLNWDNQFIQNIKLKESLRKILKNKEKEWRKVLAEKRKKKIKKELEKSTDGVKGVWIDNIPFEYRKPIEEMISILMTEDIIDAKNADTILNILRTDIIPSRPQAHWRKWAPEIINSQNVMKYYNQGAYHSATNEAIKLYIKEVQRIMVTTKDGSPMIDLAFSPKKGKIKLMNRTDDLGKNIQTGHWNYSLGVIFGFRNIFAHKDQEELESENILTEIDCMDTLSLISHLFNRLRRITHSNTNEN